MIDIVRYGIDVAALFIVAGWGFRAFNRFIKFGRMIRRDDDL